jgi:hypothetical protein
VVLKIEPKVHRHAAIKGAKLQVLKERKPQNESKRRHELHGWQLRGSGHNKHESKHEGKMKRDVCGPGARYCTCRIDGVHEDMGVAALLIMALQL